MPPPADRFAAPDRLLPVAEALRLIRDSGPAVAGIETVPLWAADRRVLAEPLVAAFPLPPFDNAAVDGFAVRFADLSASGPTTLPVAGRVAAGEAAGPAPPGCAIRILTGAPMPAGFDTVTMQEHVGRDGALATLPAGLVQGANRRRAGEDIAAGRVALAAGRRLGPADLGLAGALGHTSLRVRRPLAAILFSTGSEIAAEPGPAGRHDANRPMLAALLRRFGCQVTDGGILPDRPDAVAAALAAAAAAHDLVVTSGGVSAGDEDHVRAAAETLGALSFWRLAIKPGRPAVLGTVAGRAFLGLPGNPVAAFVTACVLGRALVARLAGEDWREPVALPVPAGFAHAKRAGLREYLRVRLAPDGRGHAVAAKHGQDGSGILTSLTETDGFAVLPEDLTEVVPGAAVPFLPFAALF